VPLRIVYAGTPAFAVPALEAIIRAGHHVVAVLTQPDRPAGRGRVVQMSAVKESALVHDLPVLQPANLQDPVIAAKLHELRADVFVVAAYGLLLPGAVLKIPTLGCLNIHPSLLPRWRGAAPIPCAIMANDEYTGVAIMQMDVALDSGPIFAIERVPIDPHENAAELSVRLAHRGADLLVQVLKDLASGSAIATPQPSEGIDYAPKLNRTMAQIDWARSATLIDCHVRALVPWPIAETIFMRAVLKIHRAQSLVATTSAAPGTILDVGVGGIDVATGDGVLRLSQVQTAGRKVVSGHEFARNAVRGGSIIGLTFGMQL